MEPRLSHIEEESWDRSADIRPEDRSESDAAPAHKEGRTPREAAGEVPMPFSLNQTLVESTGKIKAELTLLRTRIEKMETHRQEVSEAVYQTVRDDYAAQYRELVEQFRHKQGEVNGELEKLYHATRDVTLVLNQHREALEEAKFRHFLGEFSDQKYKAIEKREDKEIAKQDQILEQLQDHVQRYEALVMREEELLKEHVAKKAKREDSPAAKPLLNREEDDEHTHISEPVPYRKEATEESVKTVRSDFTETASHSEESASVQDILQGIAVEMESSLEAETPRPVAAVPPPAKLILLETGGDPATFSEKPIHGPTLIGRLPNNPISLPSTKVSRKHAEIVVENSAYLIRDLESANGVYVNGERVEEQVLKNGDEIRIGRYKLRFEADVSI